MLTRTHKENMSSEDELSKPSRKHSAVNYNNLMVGVHGGNSLLSSLDLGKLKKSEFNTIICGSVHIDHHGSLIYNESGEIVRGGAYTGPNKWPEMLRSVVCEGSGFKKLVFSVGSTGSQDFKNIRELISIHGISPLNPLDANFRALKREIPQITEIDLKNEDDFDERTIVDFAQILHSIGFSVTFCPYHKMEFWEGALHKVYSRNRSIVVGYNLQCYAGGEGNANEESLSKWIESVQAATSMSFKEAAAFVRPGLRCRYDRCTRGMFPFEVVHVLSSWSSLGISGAWISFYDDIESNANVCTKVTTSIDAYSSAVIESFTKSK